MINTNKWIITSLFGMLTCLGLAQPVNWISFDIPNVTAYNSHDLYYSENLHLALFTCVFQTESGNRYLAGYNDSEWVTIADSVGGSVRTIVDYSDGIIVGGGTPYIGTQNMPHIAYFDGNIWSYPWSFNGNVNRLQWVNDTLFAMGGFTEIDGVPAYNIARLVNGHWEGVYQPTEDLDFAIFGAMAYFQGKYYVGGNFESVVGPDDLAILENGALLPVGSGLTGGYTSVSMMEVYQGELYIAGLIAVSQGNVANHILKWNGTNFSTVGDTLYYIPGQLSTYGGVVYMKQKNGYLYIAGSFRYIGGLPVYKVARWDGTQWCGMFTQEFQQDTEFEQYVSSLGFFENKLIIVHPYFYGDGTFDSFWIYDGGDEVSACTEPLYVEENNFNKISLYPNPTSGIIHIQSEVEINSVEIINALGKAIFSKETRGQNIEINLRDFPTGLYFVRVKTDSGTGVEKLILR